MDPVSIDAFSETFLGSGRPLHLLINNAGIMAAPLVRDARGYESHFSANHLGHFHLTARLWPALQQAKGARVVTLSSGAHRQAAVDFDDLNFERRDYDKWKAYGQSKTANVLFTVALDQRGASDGIRAFAVHPGRIETNLQRFIPMEELQARGLRNEKRRNSPGAAKSLQDAATRCRDHGLVRSQQISRWPGRGLLREFRHHASCAG
nr:SDR family NAD(P)-dependent oxidoreductase [Rhizobium bangladeshense]